MSSLKSVYFPETSLHQKYAVIREGCDLGLQSFPPVEELEDNLKQLDVLTFGFG